VCYKIYPGNTLQTEKEPSRLQERRKILLKMIWNEIKPLVSCPEKTVGIGKLLHNCK
jgi:hypothetical protein